MSNNIKEHALTNESRYTLVMVAAKRARQIVEGSPPMSESKSNKPVLIALDEIEDGKVKYVNPTKSSYK